MNGDSDSGVLSMVSSLERYMGSFDFEWFKQIVTRLPHHTLSLSPYDQTPLA
jgi:hypothetical protein